MKELGCKILAIVFIIAIIFSLIEMRRDVLSFRRVSIDNYTVELAPDINVHDYVLILKQNRIGCVVGVTNNVYYVMYHDKLNNHAQEGFRFGQIKKVVIIPSRPR